MMSGESGWPVGVLHGGGAVPRGRGLLGEASADMRASNVHGHEPVRMLRSCAGRARGKVARR